MHNASISGDVTQFAGGGGRNCTPSGVFKLFKSPVYSTYEDSSVGGDVVVRGVRSCWMGTARLHVGGDMIMWWNKLADPDAIEILANHIALTWWAPATAAPGTTPTRASTSSRIPEPNKVAGHRVGQCVLSSPTKRGDHPGPGPF